MRRRAFTLLEVLLATVLSATLLLALWSLFRVYSNLFVAGQDESLRQQLIRSLTEQLTSDLQNTIQDPTAGPAAPAEGTGSVRRFSLSGTSRELRIDVLETSPVVAEQALDESQDAAIEFNRTSEPPRLPELRTVVYEFVAPASPDDPLLADDRTAALSPVAEPLDAEPLPSGLIRRQYRWDAPDGDTSAAGDDPLEVIETAQVSDAEIEAVDLSAANPLGPMDAEAEAPIAVIDDAEMIVPEVASLEFRYYDGRSWTSSWDSVARKGLPLAVEATFEVKALEEEPAADADSVATEPLASQEFVPAEEGEASPLEQFAEDAGLVETADRQRIVILLPASPFARPRQQFVPRTLADGIDPPPRPPAVSVPAVRPSRPAGPSRTRAADGLLRNLP
jgi:type II secretory pathway pseudopilin PulG